MAEGYPSKWAAASQGLLQGMQAGVLMDTNIRAGNQQTLENKRYDVALKTAADKQQWDRDMQLMGEVRKLKTPEQQMNLVKAYLAKQPDSQFAKTLVEVFSTPNSATMSKELKDAVDSGDAIKAYQLGANLGLPEAGIKVVLEQAKAQKETVLSQNATRAAVGIPPSTELNIPSQTLLPQPLPDTSNNQGLLGSNVNLNAKTDLNPAIIPQTTLLQRPTNLTPEQQKNQRIIDTGNPDAMKLLQGEALKKKEKTPSYHIIKDDKSPTGYSYQNLNNPATILPNAPNPIKTSSGYRTDAVMTRFIDKFNADPTIRKIEQMDEFANLITSVAKSDNPIGYASLETLMARASGEVGNLSEADKKPFGGSRALTMKVSQYFSELYSGKKTPENLKFISDLAETFAVSGRNKKTSLARERAKQYARANKGFKEEDIFNMLAPDAEYTQRRATDKQGGGNVMTFDPNTGVIK